MKRRRRIASTTGKPSRTKRRKQTYGDIEAELAKASGTDWSRLVGDKKHPDFSKLAAPRKRDPLLVMAEEMSKPTGPGLTEIFDRFMAMPNLEDFDFSNRSPQPEPPAKPEKNKPAPVVAEKPQRRAKPAKTMTAAQRRRLKLRTEVTAWLNEKQDLERFDRDHYKKEALARYKNRKPKLSGNEYYRALKDTGRTRFGPKLPPIHRK